MYLLRKRRGVSGIISGVFLVTASLMLFTTFYWQFVQQDHYYQVMLNRMNMEWERLNERLLVSDVEKGATTLRFNVTNFGSVSANITDLYLTDKSASPTQYWRYGLGKWIAPGTRVYVDTKIPISIGASYEFRIATQRGNTFEPTEGSIVNQSGPLGGQPTPFVLSFSPSAFEFIVESQDKNPVTWNSKKSGWYINGTYVNNAVAFRLNVTNNYNQKVVILSSSTMLLITPDIDSATMKIGYKTYIMKEGSGLTYEPGKWTVQAFPSKGQAIESMKSSYVYFSAKTENGTDAIALGNAEDRNYSNYVTVFYKVGDDPTIYGATIAIIAMQIKTYNKP